MDSLRLPARDSSLPDLLRLAQSCARRAGLDEQTVQRVELVLEEALVNIISHAYPQDEPNPQVQLDCKVAGGALTLTVTDWGAAFDPVLPTEHDADLAANLEADLDNRVLGGLGLILIRGMSQAAYARVDGANVLTLNFPPAG
ncbi:MAG: hypothetical protein AUJ49_03740 [Desulfovibrionaceae bacterium CG1_02_65_16]|nr:MAG: hypothetical protein AUJ49_03740 [Desulfovibrionaceae bacterium CG1_02_65_16]